jgi:FkbM family methyltransferase
LANLYVSLFGRRAFYGWNQRLLNLAVRGMGVGSPTSALVMPAETRFLQSLGQLGTCNVFDVGAHVGEWAILLRRFSPNARIWSFEPHPGSYRQLTEAAQASGFTAVNLGLSDRRGTLQLYDYQGASASGTGAGSSHASVHPEVFSDIHHGEATAVEVEVTTVDDFLDSAGIDHLTLLKIDAEGHELAILRGATRALTAGRISIVQFEFNEMNVISRVFFRDFYEALPAFDFFRMVVDGLAPMGAYQPRTHELFIPQNVVAIRSGLEGREAIV